MGLFDILPAAGDPPLGKAGAKKKKKRKREAPSVVDTSFLDSLGGGGGGGDDAGNASDGSLDALERGIAQRRKQRDASAAAAAAEGADDGADGELATVLGSVLPAPKRLARGAADAPDARDGILPDEGNRQHAFELQKELNSDSDGGAAAAAAATAAAAAASKKRKKKGKGAKASAGGFGGMFTGYGSDSGNDGSNSDAEHQAAPSAATPLPPAEVLPSVEEEAPPAASPSPEREAEAAPAPLPPPVNTAGMTIKKTQFSFKTRKPKEEPPAAEVAAAAAAAEKPAAAEPTEEDKAREAWEAYYKQMAQYQEQQRLEELQAQRLAELQREQQAFYGREARGGAPSGANIVKVHQGDLTQPFDPSVGCSSGPMDSGKKFSSNIQDLASRAAAMKDEVVARTQQMQADRKSKSQYPR